MAKYIDKAEVLNSVGKIRFTIPDVKEVKELQMLIGGEITELPTIDIVHCYECMNGEIVNAGCTVWCNHLSFGFDKYHFCKWGERK